MHDESPRAVRLERLVANMIIYMLQATVLSTGAGHAEGYDEGFHKARSKIIVKLGACLLRPVQAV
jgi:hypothetical protein